MRNEKTWIERIPFVVCKCEHGNTVHAGAVGACAVLGCSCSEFKERMTPAEEPTTFQQVKKIMSGEVEF